MGNHKSKIQKDSDPDFSKFCASLLQIHSTQSQTVQDKPSHEFHLAKHEKKADAFHPKSRDEELKRLGIRTFPGETKIEAKPFHLAQYFAKVKAPHRPKDAPGAQATYGFYEEKYAQHIGRTPVRMEPWKEEPKSGGGISKEKRFASVQEALAAKIDCKVKISLTEPIMIDGKVTTLYDGMHAKLDAREASKKLS